MKKIASFVLAFVLAVGLIAPVVAASASDSHVHIVQRGDTLWSIARAHDTTWQALAEYNQLENPHLIFPGQVIRIPVRLRDYVPTNVEDTPELAYEYAYGDEAPPYLPGEEYVPPYQPGIKVADQPTFISEEVVIGYGSRWPLGGTLTMPSGASLEAPVPAVVLVHGSGATDRNLAVGPSQAFYDIAEYLSANGIAVLRYDKRTYTHDVVEAYGPAFTVWEETIEDAILAADLLRTDPRIDPYRIYMAGLSLGGMLAPRIQTSGGNFAGLIIMAGSPRQLLEITIDQERDLIELTQYQLENLELHLQQQLEELTMQLMVLESQVEFIENIIETEDFETLRAADPAFYEIDDEAALQLAQDMREEATALYQQLSQALYAVIEAMTEESMEEIDNEGREHVALWAEALDALEENLEAITEMSAEDAQAAMLGAFPAYYIRDMALNPTPELLAEITVPMLILQGGNDFQVFAHRDFVLFEELLGYRDNVTFRLYPGLSHVFMSSIATNLNESLFERDYVPGNVYFQVLRDIVDWVLAH